MPLTDGPRSATQGVGVVRTSSTLGAFGTPGNIVSSNEVDATIASGAVVGFSDWLKARSFGVSISGLAIILGIEYNIEGASGTTANMRIDNASLATAASEASILGTSKVTSPFATGGDTIKTLGGPSDLWGLTRGDIDGNDVGSADWGPLLSAGRVTAATSTLGLDHVTQTLTYTIPPNVESNTPLDNAIDIPVSTAIVVNFTAHGLEMDTVSTESAFSINPPVAGSFSWNAGNTILTFTPNAPLAHAQNYIVTVTNAALNEDAEPLILAPHIFDFTTIAAAPAAVRPGGTLKRALFAGVTEEPAEPTDYGQLP